MCIKISSYYLVFFLIKTQLSLLTGYNNDILLLNIFYFVIFIVQLFDNKYLKARFACFFCKLDSSTNKIAI